MWDKFKECLWDLMGLFGWAWILFHFVMIAIYGRIEIYEKYPWILYSEIVIGTCIWILGLVRTIKDFRKDK